MSNPERLIRPVPILRRSSLHTAAAGAAGPFHNSSRSHSSSAINPGNSSSRATAHAAERSNSPPHACNTVSPISSARSLTARNSAVLPIPPVPRAEQPHPHPRSRQSASARSRQAPPHDAPAPGKHPSQHTPPATSMSLASVDARCPTRCAGPPTQGSAEAVSTARVRNSTPLLARNLTPRKSDGFRLGPPAGAHGAGETPSPYQHEQRSPRPRARRAPGDQGSAVARRRSLSRCSGARRCRPPDAPHARARQTQRSGGPTVRILLDQALAEVRRDLDITVELDEDEASHRRARLLIAPGYAEVHQAQGLGWLCGTNSSAVDRVPAE